MKNIIKKMRLFKVKIILIIKKIIQILTIITTIKINNIKIKIMKPNTKMIKNKKTIKKMKHHPPIKNNNKNKKKMNKKSCKIMNKK